MENLTSNIAYHKASYQKKSWITSDYENFRYQKMFQKNPKKQLESQSSRCQKIHHYNKKRKTQNQQTPEVKRAYRKRRYQENRKRNKKYQKGGAWDEKNFFDKVKKIHHQIKQGGKWREKYVDDGRSIYRYGFSLNLPVPDVTTVLYYKQRTDKRKCF